MKIVDNNISKEDINQLSKLMSSGDEKAFRKLYDLYYDKIFAVSLSFTKSQVISEEIVQDVFLKIWLKREVFSGVHDFEAYLFITARNHILNCLRSRMKEVVFLDYLHSYFVVSEDVTSILHAKEIHKFIAEARELLPPQQRRVFELSRYEGLNYQAIAEKLDISTLTVKSHMTKALNFIRLRLELLDMFYFLLIHVGFMYN